MTKEQFPKGLNRTIVAFEKAFYEIMTTDEIDKVIKASDERDAARLTGLRDAVREDYESYLDCIWIITMQTCNAELLRDIIAHMVMADTEIIPTEQL